MDTYRKMLSMVFEAAGGRESVDVDFVEIAKREGYFPSIDDIVTYLKSESWVTESRSNVLRLTHWGIAQVRKDATGGEAVEGSRKTAEKLRELSLVLSKLSDDLVAEPTSSRIEAFLKKNAEIASVAEQLRSEV